MKINATCKRDQLLPKKTKIKFFLAGLFFFLGFGFSMNFLGTMGSLSAPDPTPKVLNKKKKMALKFIALNGQKSQSSTFFPLLFFIVEYVDFHVFIFF